MWGLFASKPALDCRYSQPLDCRYHHGSHLKANKIPAVTIFPIPVNFLEIEDKFKFLIHI